MANYERRRRIVNDELELQTTSGVLSLNSLISLPCSLFSIPFLLLSFRNDAQLYRIAVFEGFAAADDIAIADS